MTVENYKLGDLCTMRSGGTPRRNNLKFYGGDIPWCKISDIESAKGGIIFETEEKITEEGLSDINNRMFKKGTLLLAMYGSVGKVALIGRDMSTNQAILGINIIDEKKLNYNYLIHWFYSIKEKLLNRAVGAALQNISLGIVKELEIPLPPLDTQKAIAEKLDIADTLRKKDQQLLKLYDELAQSVFIEMFGDPVRNEKGWEVKKLDEICGVGSSKRVFVDELVDEGVPFYRGTEVGLYALGIQKQPSLFITYEHYMQLKVETGVPAIGDLLLPSICPDGRIFEITTEEPFYFKDGRVLWIKNDQKVCNSVYLKCFLKLKFAKDYHKIASGTTFAELKIFALKSLDITIPSLVKQQVFASIIKNIEVQKALLKVQAAESENLFQSLLQESFA